jgi:hypothetical protein
MLEVVGLGLSMAETFLSKYKSQLPAEVIAAVEATIAALTAHQADLLTKANFEAQRG